VRGLDPISIVCRENQNWPISSNIPFIKNNLSPHGTSNSSRKGTMSAAGRARIGCSTRSLGKGQRTGRFDHYSKASQVVRNCSRKDSCGTEGSMGRMAEEAEEKLRMLSDPKNCRHQLNRPPDLCLLLRH
jgi:hypothetical protein